MIFSLSAGGVKMQTGSYVGNGQSGSGSQTSITFDFVPKLVIVGRPVDGLFPSSQTDAQLWHTDSFIWIEGMESQLLRNRNGWTYRYYSLNGTTLSWYATIGAEYQANQNNTTYIYLAFG